MTLLQVRVGDPDFFVGGRRASSRFQRERTLQNISKIPFLPNRSQIGLKHLLRVGVSDLLS